MATIGTFKQIGEGEFLGDIFTLSLRATGVRIVSVTRTSDSARRDRGLLVEALRGGPRLPLGASSYQTTRCAPSSAVNVPMIVDALLAFNRPGYPSIHARNVLTGIAR
jgi:hypothetical protein